METNHKQFKPFDKVLVRFEDIDDYKWNADLYSHYSDDHHVCVAMPTIYDNDILPYKGNEHLVGTTDEPEEEITFKTGEWVMVADKIDNQAERWQLRRLLCPRDGEIIVQSISNLFSETVGYNFFIIFEDFNPNDMKETLKHALCVKDGKIVKPAFM